MSHPEKRTDAEIQRDTDIALAVRLALKWNVLVPEEHIRTTVTHGTVTIEGKVDDWSQYDDAARSVTTLPGVREVVNLLQVEEHGIEPQTVRRAIDGALARHAQHAAKHIQIIVADGKVILTGFVPSMADKKAVLGAVRGTPGVRKVENNLRIQV